MSAALAAAVMVVLARPGAAQRQFEDLRKRGLPPDRDPTEAVALGDVDGDGDLDLVVGNWGRQNRLYLNLLRQLDGPFLARVGCPYELEAYARYGPPSLFAVAVPFLATATARIPVSPFGTFGLDPRQMVALPPLLIPQPAGVSSVPITVPNVPGLAGLSLYAQALLVPYPFQGRLTNVTGDLIVR